MDETTPTTGAMVTTNGGTAGSPKMARWEREELAKLLRQEVRVARMMAVQREAELIADGEAKIAARYAFSDEHWSEITAAAEAAVKQADALVAAKCRELGIPPAFRPGLNVSWYSRGENAVRERRQELYRVLKTRVAAMGKAAVAAIEARALEGQRLLAQDALESAAAREFVAAMPKATELMPKLDAAELKLLKADDEEGAD